MTARRAIEQPNRWRLRWVLPAALVVVAGLLVAGTALRQPTPTPGVDSVAGTEAPTVPPATSPAPAPATTAARATTPSAAPATLVLMSFNILTSDPIIYGRNPLIPRRELAFAARAPGIATQITTAAPDVVALQENFGNPMPYELLRGRLPDYTWVQSQRQVSILFRTARFTLVSSGYRKLHETEKGFLSWAKVTDLTTGRPLWIFDVHLRAGNQRAQALIRSVETDRAWAHVLALDPGLSEPAVVMGDLNTAAAEKRALYSDPVKKLGSRGLVDAATVAQADLSNVRNASSIHGFKAVIGGRTYAKVVPRTRNRIDYIFVPRTAAVTGFGVLTGPRLVSTSVNGHAEFAWKGIVPSDHSPVIAEIALPEG